MTVTPADVTAIILAGGMGRRLGGADKGLVEFNGEPLVARLIKQLESQQLSIMINANRNDEQYRSFGYPVYADDLGDFQGPLAGFAGAMRRAQTRYIVTVPCDGPWLAADYLSRFITARQASASRILVADDGERLQPVHAMIETALLDDLLEFLDSGDRKIDRWYGRHDFGRVDFSDAREMFRNINTAEEQQTYESAGND